MYKYSVCFLVLWISLVSKIFCNVEFVTKPPSTVTVYPGQNVSLPCVFNNNLIPNHHIVEWSYWPSYDIQYNISHNRNILLPSFDNISESYTILSDGMNFTLFIKIPRLIDVESSSTSISTYYRCSVFEPSKDVPVATANSTVIIQQIFRDPVCLKINKPVVIGETLSLGCYSTETYYDIKTILKVNKQVLHTNYYVGPINVYNLTVTKEHHNAVFVCESRRKETNEIRSCSVGTITVNYKPEIIITQISPLEYHCTAEARPPVNETVWIIEPNIPQENYEISNNTLILTEKLKAGSVIKCLAENEVGNTTKIFQIFNSNENQNKRNNSNIFIIIVAVSVGIAVIIIVTIIFLFRKKLLQRENKTKKQGASQNKIKSNGKEELVYDYATIDVTDYQETENSNISSNKRNNGPSKELNDKKKKQHTYSEVDEVESDNIPVYSELNTPDYKECENEIYEGPTGGADSKEGGVQDNVDVYSEVNKPDYKECENEIYQGPEM